MKNATYVEAARRGSHRWWRYLLGLVIILFAWLVVGTVASAILPNRWAGTVPLLPRYLFL